MLLVVAVPFQTFPNIAVAGCCRWCVAKSCPGNASYFNKNQKVLQIILRSTRLQLWQMTKQCNRPCHETPPTVCKTCSLMHVPSCFATPQGTTECCHTTEHAKGVWNPLGVVRDELGGSSGFMHITRILGHVRVYCLGRWCGAWWCPGQGKSQGWKRRGRRMPGHTPPSCRRSTRGPCIPDQLPPATTPDNALSRYKARTYSPLR